MGSLTTNTKCNTVPFSSSNKVNTLLQLIRSFTPPEQRGKEKTMPLPFRWRYGRLLETSVRLLPVCQSRYCEIGFSGVCQPWGMGWGCPLAPLGASTDRWSMTWNISLKSSSKETNCNRPGEWPYNYNGMGQADRSTKMRKNKSVKDIIS
jgi:hypothetical protein